MAKNITTLNLKDLRKIVNESVRILLKENAVNDNTPRIYVGTYGKYNDGSLKGEWVDLSDFNDRDEFLEYCAELHGDEGDPEFMFQDWENIPDGMVGESFVDEHLWDWMRYDYDDDIKKAVMDECNGDWDRFENVMDDIMLFPGCYDMSDVAEQCVDEGMISPEYLKYHFDYGHFGRECAMDYYGDSDDDTIYSAYGVDEGDDWALGEEIISEQYGDNIPKELLEQYIDYDGLGRDLDIENTFIRYDGGMIELIGY